MPQDPYAEFGPPVQAKAKADPYAEFGPPVKAAAPDRSTLSNVAHGFGASAAESLISAGKVGSYIPGVSYIADKVGDLAGLPKLSGAAAADPYAAVEKATEPAREQDLSTTAGKVGGGIETLAEFVTGDEALKGLHIADKLSLAAKAANLAKKSPKLAKALEIGMNAVRKGSAGEKALDIGLDAVRTGAVGAAQGLGHGEDLGTAAETGAITGGLGAAADVVGLGLGKVVQQAKGAASKFTIAGEEGRVGARVLTPEGQIASEKLQNGVRGIAHDVATPAGSVSPADSAFLKQEIGDSSIRDVFEKVSDDVRGSAQKVYKKIDAATGNLWQTNQNAIDAVERGIRGAADDGTLEKLLARRAELETEHDTILEIAREGGVSDAEIGEAKRLYKQQAALLDLNKQVEMATTGIRPEMAESLAAHPGEAAVPNQTLPQAAVDSLAKETLDPAKLEPRLQKLYNSGRLQAAVGKDQAANMILLTELMKQRQALVKGLNSAFLGTLAHHPLTASTHLLLATAKDVWGAVLNSPTATRIATYGLKAGLDATRLAPALVNAVQIDDDHGSKSQQDKATPDTHHFSQSAWQQANPGGNVQAAAQQAQQQGYTLIP